MDLLERVFGLPMISRYSTLPGGSGSRSTRGILLLGVYLAVCVALAIKVGAMVISIPFLMLFATGYLYVGLTSVRGSMLRGSTSR